MRLCIPSVGYLHELSDAALTGELEQRLSCMIPAVSQAIEEAEVQNQLEHDIYQLLHQPVQVCNLPSSHRFEGRSGIATSFDAESGTFSVETHDEGLLSIPPQHLRRLTRRQATEEDQRAIGAALQMLRSRANVWTTGPFRVRLDRSRFAQSYEASSFALDKLTRHQLAKLDEIMLRDRVHLRAPAGAGKTFVALHRILCHLLDEGSSGHVLFAAKNEPLCYFLVRWLCLRTPNTLQRLAIFRRLHVLHMPFSVGPRAIELVRGQVVLRTLHAVSPPHTPPTTTTPTAAAAAAYGLVVIDEAHHIYARRELAEQVAPWIPSSARLLLLSDLSQSMGLGIHYPLDTAEVTLTEVVRSSQRIVSGASAFALGGLKGGVACQHAASGPPLKTFLFEARDRDEQRMGGYVEHVLAALEHVALTFGTMSLHNRLAILVPSAEFASQLRAVLQPKLPVRFPQRRFVLVSALDAASVVLSSEDDATDAAGTEQWLAIDEVSEFDGLERLVVVAVDLDAPVDGGAADVLAARSQLYRALTRAHLMVVVVQAALPGGWLEFLGHVSLKETRDALTFNQEKASSSLNGSAVDKVTEETAARVEGQPVQGPPTGSAATDSASSVQQASAPPAPTDALPAVVAQSIWDTSSNSVASAGGARAAPKFMPFIGGEAMHRHDAETLVEGGKSWWFDGVRITLPADESTPVVARYEVLAQPGVDVEVIGAFSLSRAAFGRPGADALTWYAAVHRSDFTFRTKVFGEFVRPQGGQPFKISPDVWHAVEVHLSKRRAAYYIDGRLFATAALKPGDTPDEGYFGMITYATPYLFRRLQVVTALGAASRPESAQSAASSVGSSASTGSGQSAAAAASASRGKQKKKKKKT